MGSVYNMYTYRCLSVYMAKICKLRVMTYILMFTFLYTSVLL